MCTQLTMSMATQRRSCNVAMRYYARPPG